MRLPRFTRRGTLKTTAALVGGSFAMAMARAGAVVGQPATPVSTPADEGIDLLFVQSYAASTLSPTSDDGVLAMVLEGGTGETIYFADRPGRQVGTIASGTFIDIFRRETADDPANAVLVAGNGASEETTYIVEFVDMLYDESTATATYTVRLLADPTVVSFAVAGDPAVAIDVQNTHQVSTLFIDSGGLMQLVAYGAQDVFEDNGE